MDRTIEFVALKDFYDEDLRSSYVAGMTYTCRGSAGMVLEDTPLFLKLEGWLETGRVRLKLLGEDQGIVARLRGQGEVQTISAADVGTLKL